MDADPNPKATPGTEKKVRPEEEVHDALEWLKEYGPAAAVGLILAIVIFLGIVLFRQSRDSSQATASELFLTAQTPDQYQVIVDQYPSTPVAPMALLAVASERFHEGRIDVAETHYREFISQYPDHVMIPAAVLGLAHCHEAAGRMSEALAAFRAFVQAQPDHYLTPPARLSEARILAATGQIEEARSIYESYLEDPEDPWRAQARTDLLYMEKNVRAQTRAAE